MKPLPQATRLHPRAESAVREHLSPKPRATRKSHSACYTQHALGLLQQHCGCSYGDSQAVAGASAFCVLIMSVMLSPLSKILPANAMRTRVSTVLLYSKHTSGWKWTPNPKIELGLFSAEIVSALAPLALGSGCPPPQNSHPPRVNPPCPLKGTRIRLAHGGLPSVTTPGPSTPCPCGGIHSPQNGLSQRVGASTAALTVALTVTLTATPTACVRTEAFPRFLLDRQLLGLIKHQIHVLIEPLRRQRGWRGPGFTAAHRSLKRRRAAAAEAAHMEARGSADLSLHAPHAEAPHPRTVRCEASHNNAPLNTQIRVLEQPDLHASFLKHDSGIVRADQIVTAIGQARASAHGETGRMGRERARVGAHSAKI